MGKKLDVIDVNERNVPIRKELSMEEKRRRRQRQRARQLAIKRHRRKRFLQMLVFMAVSVIALVIAGKLLFTIKEDGKQQENMSVVGALLGSYGNEITGKEELLYEVKYEEFFEANKPKQLSDAEVYRRLKKLAKDYPELEEIYEKREEYPVRLLASLCNNPELYEYAEDYPAYQNGDTSVTGKNELTRNEKEQKYPLFLQWDKRWGYEAYGDFNIALSGCGPTTLAMAAVALTDNHSITPDVVAEYSMENGFYVEGTGTAWNLMTDGCENFGLKAEEIALDEYVMKNQLDEGKVIICSMRPGDFTSVGHFVMIYGYNADGFFINDANCIYRSSKIWPYNELKNQIRILWAFEKN